MMNEDDNLMQSLSKKLLFSESKKEPSESAETPSNLALIIMIENLKKENQILRDESNGVSCLFLMMLIDEMIKKIK